MSTDTTGINLTDEEITAVQASIEEILPNGRTVSLTFYQTLFQLDPRLAGLFHGDMVAMGQKFIDMLEFIAVHLSHPEVLVPAVEDLGIRHAGYRVQPEHYQTVCQALVKTLSSKLSPDMAERAVPAWGKAYAFLSETMIRAAEEAAEDASKA